MAWTKIGQFGSGGAFFLSVGNVAAPADLNAAIHTVQSNNWTTGTHQFFSTMWLYLVVNGLLHYCNTCPTSGSGYTSTNAGGNGSAGGSRQPGSPRGGRLQGTETLGSCGGYATTSCGNSGCTSCQKKAPCCSTCARTGAGTVERPCGGCGGTAKSTRVYVSLGRTLGALTAAQTALLNADLAAINFGAAQSGPQASVQKFQLDWNAAGPGVYLAADGLYGFATAAAARTVNPQLAVAYTYGNANNLTSKLPVPMPINAAYAALIADQTICSSAVGAANQTVVNFQSAYNVWTGGTAATSSTVDGTGTLFVSGVMGPETLTALNVIVAYAGYAGTFSCNGSSLISSGQVPVSVSLPATPPATIPPVMTYGGGMTPPPGGGGAPVPYLSTGTPWIVTGLAIVGAVGAYYVYQNRHAH